MSRGAPARKAACNRSPRNETLLRGRQNRGDVGEVAVERGRQGLERPHDTNGNEGRDEGVFNRGCARLIIAETRKQVLHGDTPGQVGER